MKDTKDFQERYNRWKNGERYWDIRGIDLPKYDTGDKNTVVTDDGSVFNVDPSAINARNLEVTTPEVQVIAEKPLYLKKRDQVLNNIIYNPGEIRQGEEPSALDNIRTFLSDYRDNPIARNVEQSIEDWQHHKTPMQAAFDNFAYMNPYTAAIAAGSNLLSDHGIRRTINLTKNGQYRNAALSGIGDLFDAALAYPLINKSVGIGKQILMPSNRAAHAYYAISPIGYDNISQKSRAWIKSMLTGKYPDIENPPWLNDSGLTKLTEYIHPIVQNPTALATQGRIDAWRIYNQLPQKYNTFIKRADGSYYYNLNKIKKLTNNTMVPYSPDGQMIDYLGSAGGRVNIDPIYSKLLEIDPVNKTLTRNGIDVMSDTWDLQPFKSSKNSLANRIISTYASNIVPKIQNIRQFLFDKNIVGIDARYPFSRYVSRLENRTLNRLRNTIPFENFIYNISDKLKNFEVGTISGGKPFLIKTIIPYNYTYLPMYQKDFGIIKTIGGGLGFSDKYVHPIKIKDLNKFNEEYVPQANIIANDKIKKP